MEKNNISEEHDKFVKFLLKKSEEKDPKPQKDDNNVDMKEIEALTKKIKEKLKV